MSIDHQHVDKERGANKGEVVYRKIEVLEHSIFSILENLPDRLEICGAKGDYIVDT